MELSNRVAVCEFRQELPGDVICAGFFRTVRSIDYGDFHIYAYLSSFFFRVLCFVTTFLQKSSSHRNGVTPNNNTIGDIHGILLHISWFIFDWMFYSSHLNLQICDKEKEPVHL